jgi:hypothetical protein
MMLDGFVVANEAKGNTPYKLSIRRKAHVKMSTGFKFLLYVNGYEFL